MTQEYDIKGMVSKIKALRRNAESLKEMSCGMQAIDRNVDRILANVRMLELDVVDPGSVIGKK